MEMPTIEIQFKTSGQMHEEVRSVYIKSVKDLIHSARGNKEELEKIDKLFKVAQWELNHLISEAYNT